MQWDAVWYKWINILFYKEKWKQDCFMHRCLKLKHELETVMEPCMEVYVCTYINLSFRWRLTCNHNREMYRDLQKKTMQSKSHVSWLCLQSALCPAFCIIHRQLSSRNMDVNPVTTDTHFHVYEPLIYILSSFVGLWFAKPHFSGKVLTLCHRVRYKDVIAVSCVVIRSHIKTFS